MKIEIESPRLLLLEAKCIGIIHRIDKGEIKEAKQMADELRQMINEQKNVLNEWRDLLFKLANKL